MSINRNLATFAKDVQTDGTLQDSSVQGISVTVTVSGGKYVIDGTSQQTMFIPKGVKYRFDVSDSSVSGHPLVFSTTSDGTHGGGSAYTTGITTSGTAGSSGAYVEVQLQQDAPDLLYYYCSSHSGMGAGAETAPQGSTYGNSDVDTHLNTSGASSGQLLGWNGSDYAWVADSDTSGIDNIVEDTSPQLGGSLDVNGQSIISASNGNIAITPNGSGKVVIDGLSHPTADGSANQVLKTDGSGNLSFVDQSSGGIASVVADTTPQLGGSLDVNGQSIVSASNGNIAITPNGSGKIILDGLSFPTADGSADQVLKTDGSGNLSFVAQSTGGGGGSLTATADGALSDGTLVAVNADGTVSNVYKTNAAAVGTAVVFESGMTFDLDAVYDPDSAKVIVAYSDAGDNTGKAVVGTVSGSSVSFGSPVTFNSGATGSVGIAYDTAANKVVIVYKDTGNSSYGTAIVGTVSGTSVSFGSETVFKSATLGTGVKASFDSANGKVVITYATGTSSGNAVVGTVSGSSITFGSEATFESANTQVQDTVYDPDVGRVLVSYRDGGNGYYGTIAVGTVSSTSISFGTPVVYNSANTGINALAYDTANNKVVVAYSDVGNNTHGYAKVGTVSGTTVSFGSAVEFEDAVIESGMSVYDPVAGKVLITYSDAGNSDYGTVIAGTVSGTSISFDTATVFESAQAYYNAIVHDVASGKNLIAYRDIGNSSYGTGVVYSPQSQSSILTSENFVGISDGAYASGATATIQTAGSTDDAQSGLTAGQSYYVQSNGTLGLSPDTIEVLAGTAVSATELLINPDTNPATFGTSQVDAHLNVSSASSGQILSWNGSDYAWTADGGGLNVVSSHSQTLSSNTTVAATDNAMSVGPLTVANGVTLTISSGARYVVV